MKILIQRVLKASVQIDNEIYSSIQRGYLLFLCLEQGDHGDKLKSAAVKVRKLRIFEDTDERMNYDILQVNGEILSISQFTLSWDGSGGHRPSFDKSLEPQTARLYYHQFNKLLREEGLTVKEGLFGANMKVELLNDGPVTFLLNF
jgi:D-tyrosyl-tRNA(Tyr) deacylase